MIGSVFKRAEDLPLNSLRNNSAEEQARDWDKKGSRGKDARQDPEIRGNSIKKRGYNNTVL